MKLWVFSIKCHTENNNNKKKQFENKLVTILKDRINKEIKRVIESKEDQAVIGIKAKRDRDIRTIKTKNRDLESEELYYKSVSINKVWNNNHIEHESNGDRNKNLSIKDYINEVKPYFKDVIIDLQKSDTGRL